MSTKQKIDVLVLDDDPDLCLLMGSLLKFANYNVECITNPLILEEKLEKVQPKLLLMDMLLSGSDGRDICGSLKANLDTKNMHIMMISAHPDADQSCREAGANDFLGKPFDMDVFLERVEKLVNKTN